HGMDALAQKHLGYQTLGFEELVPKGSNFSEIPIDRATFYAAEDAVVTYKLAQNFAPRLRDEELYKVYDELDRPLMEILFRMERDGIALDAEVLRGYSADLKKELSELEDKARRMLLDYGCKFPEEGINFGSPKQIAHVLYEELKLPILKKGKTG